MTAATWGSYRSRRVPEPVPQNTPSGVFSLNPLVSIIKTEFVTALSTISPETLEAIRRFDTCTIANAIETFQVRLKNEGYTGQGLHCVTGGFPRVLGYAATFRVRSADPPLTGGSYWDRTDWWPEMARLPGPLIAVIHNPEVRAAGGAVLGGVHAAILRGLGCAGVITDGAVRDVEDAVEIGFPMFARGLAVSHAYTHVVEFGGPVQVFGLHIRPGDLLYADCHGALSIPLEIASRIPHVAEKIRAQDRRIIDLCRSSEFSLDRLWHAIQQHS
jgi:4-hydroxy-4-methyl-2-oxoglutarate aldolase